MSILMRKMTLIWILFAGLVPKYSVCLQIMPVNNGPKHHALAFTSIEEGERMLLNQRSLSRRVALGTTFAALLAACPGGAAAKSEWSIDLSGDWKVGKKLDSVTRIKALTLLQASYPEGDKPFVDLKVTKVPLGSMATASFEPKDQFAYVCGKIELLLRLLSPLSA